MFDPELMEGEEQRRVEQQIEEAQRREQLAERDRIRHIARLLADADDEQLRAALHDDDAFARMTDSETVGALFGGRLLEYEDARQRAREAIHRELVRRQGQSEAPGR